MSAPQPHLGLPPPRPGPLLPQLGVQSNRIKPLFPLHRLFAPPPPPRPPQVEGGLLQQPFHLFGGELRLMRTRMRMRMKKCRKSISTRTRNDIENTYIHWLLH